MLPRTCSRELGMDYLVVAMRCMHLQHVQAIIANSDAHPIPFPVACMGGGVEGMLGQELLDVVGRIIYWTPALGGGVCAAG